MAYRVRTGIGGWLAFFVLTLALFSPVATAVRVYINLFATPSGPAMFGARWQALQAVEIVLAALSIGVAWYLTWRLHKVETWATVRVTILGIWLLGPALGVIDWLVTVVILDVDPGRLLGSEMVAIARSAVYCAIWTAYLLRSERVALTYPRYAEEAELAAVFE